MAAPVCSLYLQLRQLNDPDDETEILAIVYGDASERKAAAMLSNAGVPISHTTIHNHRAGVCMTCHGGAR